jgi:hypothetical protein
MNLPMSLAGNFGEIRPNHFHAGFDLRTDNKEGIPVYAIADGYISRIKISPYGYGKALYIKHPNGYTSVYGHLSSFNTEIQKYCTQIQTALESFEIDSLITPDLLPLKKGEFIAFSGNTGGSEGPHLHFEIRDSQTETPINPYLLGYKIEDNVSPRITQIAVYPLTQTASINGIRARKKITPQFTRGNYVLKQEDSVVVNGNIGLGIECYDTENNSTNKNALYSIELQSGGKRIFYYEMDKFSFDEARYVNAHIDYAGKQRNGFKIQKCFLSKNNPLTIYKEVIKGGMLNFTDDSVHWMRYIVKDYVGNSTVFMLKVKSTSKALSTPEDKKTNQPFYDCLVENVFTRKDITVYIPPRALYDDVFFSYALATPGKGMFSPIHQIMDRETALQKAITITIQANKLPDFLRAKACIVSIDKNGKKNYEGGTMENDRITTSTKILGRFAVAVDTSPPKLKHLYKNHKSPIPDLKNAKTIGILATDDLSGIKKYRATIDGNWVLCEYEFKKNLLFYTFDNTITPGKHFFHLEVMDDKNNKSIIEFNFIR